MPRPDTPDGGIQQAVTKAHLAYNEGRFEVAEQLCNSILERDSHNPGAQAILSYLALRAGNAQLGIERLRELVAHNPAADVVSLLADLLQQRGRFEEAEPFLLQAIELGPSSGPAYYKLVRNRKVTAEGGTLVAKLEALASADNLHPGDARFVHYALGKAYDDLQEYEKAMIHFDAANRVSEHLLFSKNPFPRALHRATFEKTIHAYKSQLFERSQGGLQTTMPIFIVGMPRSGTTLIEQILSSHSQVHAGGELSFWLGTPAVTENQVVMAGKRRPAQERRLAEDYIALLRKMASGKNFVTDKMPNNYMILGLIHLLLPNARFIHVRRDRSDNALSIFTTPFKDPPNFAHNRENIAFAFDEYERLMNHWRSSLPADRFLEIFYEDVVQHLETATRRMLDFCGLEWDELCLHPDRNQRIVNTPSVWQVHQPIYTTSLGRWRHYESWLGALKAKQ